MTTLAFETFGRGTFAADVSPRAVEWAEGDDDRLIQVSVAKWLNERAIDFDWAEDGRFDVGPWNFYAHHTTDPSSLFHDEPNLGADYTLWGHQLDQSIVLLGLVASSRFENGIGSHQVLSMTDWLLYFHPKPRSF